MNLNVIMSSVTGSGSGQHLKQKRPTSEKILTHSVYTRAKAGNTRQALLPRQSHMQGLVRRSILAAAMGTNIPKHGGLHGGAHAAPSMHAVTTSKAQARNRRAERAHTRHEGWSPTPHPADLSAKLTSCQTEPPLAVIVANSCVARFQGAVQIFLRRTSS